MSANPDNNRGPTSPALWQDEFGDSSVLNEALALLVECDRSVPHPGTDALGDLMRPGVDGASASEVLRDVGRLVLRDAAQLHHPGYFAHMDPPTPAVAQAGALWAAALNQNLLHADTAPLALQIETLVVQWFAPYFAMTGGHMTPGSSLGNLTALWTAREVAGVRRVVASESSHLSIRKAAHILGLEYVAVPAQRERMGALPGELGDLSDVALVRTAGTTSVGVIDELSRAGAAWLHVDAAWAGPLILTAEHRHLLSGIESADSVVVSAHKWLYQPKESAFVLFADSDTAHEAISFGGGYLATPNVGLQGSHGFMALPLYLTALVWGANGFAERISGDMENASRFAALVDADDRFDLWGPNETGVIAWRPVAGDPDEIRRRLDGAFVSATTITGERWWRSVAANPFADPGLVFERAVAALS